MGSVRRLAQEVERGLRETLPRLRKTVVRKLALAVGAMLEGQTPNTVELANLLPLETPRQDMREQGLRRLLKNPLLQSEAVMAPLAQEELRKAARQGQTVLLSMDPTDLGDRMAVLMASRARWRSVAAVGLGGRSRAGQHRVRGTTTGVGAGPRLVAAGSAGTVVGGSVLSLGRTVRLVTRPSLALPIAAQGQAVGRSGLWRRSHHG